MPTFNDSDNVPQLLDAGDYIFCVKDYTCKVSRGAKTAGSDQVELDLLIEPTGKPVSELLTDHPSCAWKIDTFLKSAGITLKKGESYEFQQDRAEAKHVRWINPIGARGWCRIIVEDYIGKAGDKRQGNKIGTFYVDKPKLPALAQPEVEPMPF